MSLVFRKIRKGRWYVSDDLSWLKGGEVQADALGDLATTGNSLSVYFLDNPKQDVTRLVAALALTRASVAHLDYALFDEEVLTECGIRVLNDKGETPDSLVNSWHRNLVELSAEKIISLASIIKNHSSRERVLEKKVRDAIVTALRENRIDRSRIKLNSAAVAELENASRVTTD